MTLALRYAAVSHVGLLRTGNEDSGYAGPRLLAVADGMGGHAAGEVASAVAISSVAALDEDAPGADLLDALRTAAEEANDHLREMVAADAALDGMGTTLTTLLFTGSRLGLLHIGDSRAYLLRDGELTQITHDDTLVQSLVDDGRISADEASSHPQRNMILRALDGRLDVQFDLSVREVREGDRYLLCSDGLTGPVGHDTVHEALGTAAPQEAAERLVGLALRGGGPDNVTVIVADVVDGDPTHVPVVAGAAAEPSTTAAAALPHLASGAAGRAAAERTLRAAEPGPGPEDEPPAHTRRPGRRRTALLSVVALAVLVAAGGAGWAYVHAQWYVGVDGQRVAVFRGLSGSVAGVGLSALQRRTDLRADALTELDREDVERGIRAGSSTDAARIVAVLHDRACQRAADTPAASPGGGAGAVPTAGATGAPTTAPATPAALPAGCPTPLPAPAPLPTAGPVPGPTP